MVNNMSSRMDKYDSVGSGEFSRTSRNKHIYSSNDLTELSRITTNTNVSIISDAPKSIDLDKIRSYLEKNDDRDEYKRISLELPKEEEVVIVRKEEKDYDIKSVLDRAKSRREISYEEDRHRKLNNTQIDILKSIRIKEKTISKRNEELTSPIDELNTEEKTLVNLIQNIQNKNNSTNNKDLFEDLMGDNDDTLVLGQKDDFSNDESLKEMLLEMTQNLEEIKEPTNEFTREMNIEKLKVQEEIEENEKPEIKELDKSFYTSSIMFDKNDFEGLDDLEKEVKKSSIFTKFAIFIVILMLLGTIFIIVNFAFGLNLI
jgi:D-ribose pyranose/furanose isomerase RbsD